MPYKRKTTRKGSKSYRKKRTTRRRSRKTSLHTMMRSKDLVCADVFFTKLRYIDIDTPTLNIYAGTPYHGGMTAQGAWTGYKLNSLYDANITLGSTDIPGFGAIMGMYRTYRVLNCTIKTTFYNASIYAQQAFLWAYTQETTGDPSTLSFTVPNVRELEGNKFYRACELDIEGNGHASRTMKLYCDFSSLYSTPSYRIDLSTAGVFGADPGFIIYGMLGSVNLTGGNATAAQYVQHKTVISYNCMFFNRTNDLF